MISHLLWISAGAALGANARYWLGIWALQHWGTRFPYATLIVNVTGSILLGFLVTWGSLRTLPQEWRLLLAVGFCGSYTTFSSYAVETVGLAQGSLPILAWVNIAANNLLALAAVLFGMWMARAVG